MSPFLALALALLPTGPGYGQPLYPAVSTSPIVFTWPPEDLPLAAEGEFVMGRVRDPDAHFEINGRTVTVHKEGGFLAWLPVVPGTFTFRAELASKAGPLFAERRILVAEPPAPIPAGSLEPDPQSLEPRADLELRAGDWWTARLRAAPGLRVRARRPDGPWLQLNEAAPGIYEGSFQIAPGEAFGPGPVEYELSSGFWSRARVKGTAQIQAVSGTPAIVQVKESPRGESHLRIGPGKDFLAFPPPGTRFAVTGRKGNFLRVALAPSLNGWIEARDVELSPNPLPPRAVAGDIGIKTNDQEAVMSIPLGDRVPFAVQENPALDGLTLRLYSTEGHVNWINYEGRDDFVEQASWRQEQTGVLAVTLSLRPGRKLWGWNARWEPGGVLRLSVRRPPVIDPARPLAGLRVMLDPGHTSAEHDGGIGPLGTKEAIANYAIAMVARRRLEAAGAEVFVTRTSTSDDVPLAERPVLAVERGADVFVSLHNNALPDGSDPFAKPHGFMVFYHHPQSLALARALHAAYVRDVPLPDEGFKWGDLLVARLADMPAVLVENVMMIMPEQELLLSDPAFRDRLARALVSGLRDFALEACARRPPPPRPAAKPAPKKEKPHAHRRKGPVVRPARR